MAMQGGGGGVCSCADTPSMDSHHTHTQKRICDKTRPPRGREGTTGNSHSPDQPRSARISPDQPGSELCLGASRLPCTYRREDGAPDPPPPLAAPIPADPPTRRLPAPPPPLFPARAKPESKPTDLF